CATGTADVNCRTPGPSALEPGNASSGLVAGPPSPCPGPAGADGSRVEGWVSPSSLRRGGDPRKVVRPPGVGDAGAPVAWYTQANDEGYPVFQALVEIPGVLRSPRAVELLES